MLFNIVYYLLFSLAVVASVWYLYAWFSGTDRVNTQWREAVKSGKVSSQLLKAYRSYPDKQRFLLFWLQLTSLRDRLPLTAVMAELGVYKGETAYIMHSIDPERELFLFDTFEGFIPHDLHQETGEASEYSSASFADTSAERVKELLNHSPNIHVFIGDFKTLITEIPEREYAFVSIDVDLAEPTLAGLNYFYPRLRPGGVIVVHDYNHRWKGLMNAVKSFLETIPEQAVLIPDTNSSLVIVKNKF